MKTLKIVFTNGSYKTFVNWDDVRIVEDCLIVNLMNDNILVAPKESVVFYETYEEK